MTQNSSIQHPSSPRGFSDHLYSWIESLSKNPKTLLILALSLFAFAGIYTLIARNAEVGNEKARSALYLGQSAFEKESKAINPKDTASVDVEVSFKETLSAYRKVVTDFPKTQGAFEASLAVANLFYDYGKYESALTEFKKAVEMTKKPLDRSLAQVAMGYALENLKRYTEAVETFEKALSEKEAVKQAAGFKVDVLMSTARNAALASDKVKAKLYYDKVLSEFPNSEQAAQAQTLKGRL